MNIKEEKSNDIIVCTPEGEIDIHTSVELRKVFDKIIKNNEKKLIVDFSGVPYIDSSGLATLIELLQRLKKLGGTLRLCSMAEKVKTVFEITKVHKLFSIFDTRQDALGNF